MNLSDWQKLTGDQRNEIWPTLTHSDRDAIIEADKAILTRIHPAAPEPVPVPAMPAPIVAALAGPRPAYRLVPVTPDAVLSEVRALSCYPSLRGFALVMAFLGYLVAVGLFFFGVSAGSRTGLSTGTFIVASMFSFLAATAGYQSSLLLVDLVDLHLVGEARRRNHEARK